MQFFFLLIFLCCQIQLTAGDLATALQTLEKSLLQLKDELAGKKKVAQGAEKRSDVSAESDETNITQLQKALKQQETDVLNNHLLPLFRYINDGLCKPNMITTQYKQKLSELVVYSQSAIDSFIQRNYDLEDKIKKYSQEHKGLLEPYFFYSVPLFDHVEFRCLFEKIYADNPSTRKIIESMFVDTKQRDFVLMAIPTFFDQLRPLDELLFGKDVDVILAQYGSDWLHAKEKK